MTYVAGTRHPALPKSTYADFEASQSRRSSTRRLANAAFADTADLVLPDADNFACDDVRLGKEGLRGIVTSGVSRYIRRQRQVRSAMTLYASPPATRAAEGLWRRRFTVADVEAMVAAGTIGEGERIELIGGELVPMSPKGSRHEVIKVALNRRWCKLSPDHIEIAPETTFRLSVDTYLEPDFILSDRTQAFTDVSGGDVLLVVEVADSSRRYDTGRKAGLYASFGVRELWVIDAVKMKTRVFRTPSPTGYVDVHDVPAKAVATPLHAPLAFALRLADLGIK